MDNPKSQPDPEFFQQVNQIRECLAQTAEHISQIISSVQRIENVPKDSAKNPPNVSEPNGDVMSSMKHIKAVVEDNNLNLAVCADQLRKYIGS